MSSVNKVILVGRLGRDPELRELKDDLKVCTLSVATSFTAGGTEHTEWHRVVAWGNLAVQCEQHLSKGRQVFVEGRIQSRKWKDKDGNDRTTVEVVANSVVFLDRKSSNKPKDSTSTYRGRPLDEVPDDEIEF